MRTTPSERHASDSSEQRAAEQEILHALEKELRVRLDRHLDVRQRIELDGFCEGNTPICVEIFAHQGATKPGQRRKLMADMCKLLLVEKLIGKTCRKIVAVSDRNALGFLDNSWQGRFAEEFDIERVGVTVSDSTREAVRQAQKRQRR